MTRMVGTVVRGIRTPIVKEGDNIVEIAVDSILTAAKNDGFELREKDVVGITESLVARAQGNYAKLSDIASDVNSKFTGDIAVVFPILSRNRFSALLQGIAASGKKIYLFLNYPSDEVGNQLMDIAVMDDKALNPYTDVLTEAQYRQLFGEEVLHPFTGIDYVRYYRQLIGDKLEIIFTNDPREVVKYSKEVIVANIHERFRTKSIIEKAGASKVCTLDELLASSINGSGFNPQYGLLGSNKATADTVKLFPRDCKQVVEAVQAQLWAKTGKKIEVMIYGDGAFKDPVGKIWELADPVVSPGFTDGLKGLPNEIKIKYIADNEFKNLSMDEMTAAMKVKINTKATSLVGSDATLGTTPRQLTDLLGSLCDLTSGSGDKGTPVVLVQGYFDNYATD
ncbi:MAG: coenzyme F420-0:L-glutamate ligase [Acidaminococcaceae bacterium]